MLGQVALPPRRRTGLRPRPAPLGRRKGLREVQRLALDLVAAELDDLDVVKLVASVVAQHALGDPEVTRAPDLAWLKVELRGIAFAPTLLIGFAAEPLAGLWKLEYDVVVVELRRFGLVRSTRVLPLPQQHFADLLVLHRLILLGLSSSPQSCRQSWLGWISAAGRRLDAVGAGSADSSIRLSASFKMQRAPGAIGTPTHGSHRDPLAVIDDVLIKDARGVRRGFP